MPTLFYSLLRSCEVGRIYNYSNCYQYLASSPRTTTKGGGGRRSNFDDLVRSSVAGYRDSSSCSSNISATRPGASLAWSNYGVESAKCIAADSAAQTKLNPRGPRKKRVDQMGGSSSRLVLLQQQHAAAADNSQQESGIRVSAVQVEQRFHTLQQQPPPPPGEQKRSSSSELEDSSSSSSR